VRRFITSLPGKVFSQLVVLALLLPSISLILASKGYAQVAVQPTLAVVEFSNLKAPGTGFGKLAADAVTTEISKIDQYDVLPAEFVAKAIQTLGISSPPTGRVNLFRVAQEVRAQNIVTGQISDYRIISDGVGRHAVVALSVAVYDVASETALNGASITAESTVRPNSVDEATLINDAITTGAGQAVKQIHDRSLPSATVLNTQTESALINQGTRSGFSVGQHVIVTRGRRQVATAIISDVEPDSSTIHLEVSQVGIQPGDKIHVVFELPPVTIIGANGEAHQPKPHRTVGNNASIISALLVVGLVVALLSNGNSNATGAGEVTAEAQLMDGGVGLPGVRISWLPNTFFKGNAERIQWQIWRSDVVGGPVLVQPGLQTSIDDTTVPPTTVTAYTAPLSGTVCTGESALTQPPPVALQIGRPYTYQVELLYALSLQDLPGASTSGNSGTTTSGTTTSGTTTSGTTTSGTTTSGTTTSGTTTSGTTTSGTTTSGTAGTAGTAGTSGTAGTAGTSNTCYFLSSRTSSHYATPINAPVTNSAAQGNFGSQNYTFNSVVGSTYVFVAQYVLQFSTDPQFSDSQTFSAGTLTTNRIGQLSIAANVWPKSGESTAAPAFIQNATSLWYRVGARNIIDSPGPLPQAPSTARYIFSSGTPISKPQSTPGSGVKSVIVKKHKG